MPDVISLLFVDSHDQPMGSCKEKKKKKKIEIRRGTVYFINNLYMQNAASANQLGSKVKYINIMAVCQNLASCLPRQRVLSVTNVQVHKAPNYAIKVWRF